MYHPNLDHHLNTNLKTVYKKMYLKKPQEVSKNYPLAPQPRAPGTYPGSQPPLKRPWREWGYNGFMVLKSPEINEKWRIYREIYVGMYL